MAGRGNEEQRKKKLKQKMKEEKKKEEKRKAAKKLKEERRKEKEEERRKEFEEKLERQVLKKRNAQNSSSSSSSVANKGPNFDFFENVHLLLCLGQIFVQTLFRTTSTPPVNEVTLMRRQQNLLLFSRKGDHWSVPITIPISTSLFPNMIAGSTMLYLVNYPQKSIISVLLSLCAPLGP